MKELVDRFLTWPLPDEVCSDSCASVPNTPHRAGTTLLTAAQAELMLTHVVGPTLIGLQARVEELEAADKMQDQMRSTIIKELASVVAENARLQKLVDMNQKVVEAARLYKKATESRDMPEFKFELALFDSIDELDGEKCPCSNGDCVDCHGKN